MLVLRTRYDECSYFMFHRSIGGSLYSSQLLQVHIPGERGYCRLLHNSPLAFGFTLGTAKQLVLPAFNHSLQDSATQSDSIQY